MVLCDWYTGHFPITASASSVSWLELCVSSVFASLEISLSLDGIIISQHYANDYISSGIRVVAAVKKPM